MRILNTLLTMIGQNESQKVFDPFCVAELNAIGHSVAYCALIKNFVAINESDIIRFIKNDSVLLNEIQVLNRVYSEIYVLEY